MAISSEAVSVPADQLCFGPQQEVLSEAEPQPQQLPLLPDPQPWELEAAPGIPHSSGRKARKHAREGTSPGQTSLF
ncbi:MAG: hypothetical protein ACR2FO_08580 [Actinomycetota bacterium]